MKTVYVLSNIGTPEAPTAEAVKPYLTEFLTDPDVIPLPWIFRQALVRGMIVPRRAPASAAKYKLIWTPEGSPLMVNSLRLKSELERELGGPVLLGMQFGSPSMPEALREAQKLGAEKIVFVPLYPQYAEATTGGAMRKFKKVAKNFHGKIVNFPEFPVADFFLDPLTAILKPLLSEHLLFTFHGLPESQVKATEGCLVQSDCCERAIRCYRAQSYLTAKALAKKLELKPGSWSVSFQSRLGRAKWIGPYTEDVLKALPAKGVKKVLIASPSFVSDCLETLEELGVEGRKTFLEAGGEEYVLAPCVNGDHAFAKGFAAALKAYGN